MTLTPQHYAMLHDASAIADAVITARGYLSMDDPAAVKALGFAPSQARTAPVLAMPLWDVHGQQTGWQIRPENPRQLKGKVTKYETPKGGKLQLDVHPSVQARLGDPQTPLWVTEGVKKGDALVSAGAACAVALIGVWGFKGKNTHGGKGMLLDWEHVALNGRTVYVVYDSDTATKKEVAHAQRDLVAWLRYRQALPVCVEWPEAYQQKKWGVDDFLADKKTLDDLLAMVPPTGGTPSPQPVLQPGTLPYGDTYNARRLVETYGTDLHYCWPWHKWLVWAETHWQPDDTGKLMRRAKETILALQEQTTDFLR